jgi:hypothetical protein
MPIIKKTISGSIGLVFFFMGSPLFAGSFLDILNAPSETNHSAPVFHNDIPPITNKLGWAHAGFIYDDNSLTLAPGHRMEILGPLFYSEQRETQHTWAFPLLTLAHTEDPVTDSEEYDFLYPVLTVDRYGKEYRWQLFQLLNRAGGQNQDTSEEHRVSIFPFYFQERDTDPRSNYTALFPIYGELKHRFFRDQIDFVLFPAYARTQKKDIVTYNMPYPFFHLRYGDSLFGWQAWPCAGHEHKDLTIYTNDYGDVKTNGGHDREFILWPFYFNSTNDIGLATETRDNALIPFYSLTRSKQRDSTTWFWPFGVTHTQNHEKKYDEWDAPWPLIEFAHGEGKTTRRIWPFYSQSTNKMLVDDWYAWPVYKYNRVTSTPLDRERTRILFFLYSHVNETNLDTGKAYKRDDFFPFYTHRHEFNGSERLQILAILEPFFPTSKSIERDYSPIWALWRSENNPRGHASSQSLLWNLYRRDKTEDSKKISLLFGLFQYQSTADGRRWRVCYIPVGKSGPASPRPSTGH